MSLLKPLPRFTKGQMLKAVDLMALRAQIVRQRLTAGQDSGIFLTESEEGTAIAVSSNIQAGSVALTGAITARVGLTPGSGTVRLYYYDPTTDLLVDSTLDQDVKHFSATAIPSGKYAWVQPDDSGTWWVISVEC